MKEYKEYTSGADKTHTEQICAVEFIVQGTAIGKLVSDNRLRHEPSYEQTCEESTQRKKYLTCKEIKEVKDWHTKDLHKVPVAKRQRAYS